MGLGQAIPTEINSNSLDNTLRVVDLVPTDWVLVDIRIEAVARGFGHGLLYLWARDGTLLGTASQSAMIRPWKWDR
jgi:acyl-CoA thioesterase-2